MEIKRKTVEVVWIDYDGIKWYPDRRGYWIGSVGKKKIQRLHLYVWEKYNGPVPEGYHVHHKDHDTNNNDISNLELISKEEHLAMHRKENADISRATMLKYMIPAAAKWHGSEAGHKWHSEHYQASIGDKWDEMVTLNCAVCGKPFEASILMKHKAKFCSNACKSKYRRDMKLDNIEKPCEFCGRMFWSNKYDKQRYCSVDCRNKGRSINNKGFKKSESHPQE